VSTSGPGSGTPGRSGLMVSRSHRSKRLPAAPRRSARVGVQIRASSPGEQGAMGVQIGRLGAMGVQVGRLDPAYPRPDAVDSLGKTSRAGAGPMVERALLPVRLSVLPGFAYRVDVPRGTKGSFRPMV